MFYGHSQWLYSRIFDELLEKSCDCMQVYVPMTKRLPDARVFSLIPVLTKSIICLPYQVKCSICISDYMQSTFFYLGRFIKKLADHQCSSITKGSIYHFKHNVHTAFYHSSELTRNLMFNGSISCFMFADTVYLVKQMCTWHVHSKCTFWISYKENF